MALTPSEVFEGRLRANSTFGSNTTWRAPNGQSGINNRGRVTSHSPANYNRRQNRPRVKPRTRLQYGGYDSSAPYSRVSYNTPQTVTRPAERVQETSFTEAQRERNPGIRQRQNTSSQIERIGDSVRINVPESFESTPLLSGASAGTGLGVSGSTLLTAGAVSGGALAAGAVTAAVANRIKEKGATLPGSEYVGPGNSINIDAPRSASDAIAKEHDVGYNELNERALRGELSEREFAEGIDFLDKEAIQKFAENFRSSGEWHSFVGRWGLWIKNRIEEVTGPIYPSFPGKLWDVYGKIFIHKINLIGLN